MPILWWWACAEPEIPEPPMLDVLALELDQAEQIPVWTLRLTLSEPAAMKIVVEGGGESRVFTKEAHTEHVQQLIGLVPGAEHELRILLTQGQQQMSLDPLPFLTDPVPEGAYLPLQILAHDPDRADPGWLLLSPQSWLLPEGAFPGPLLLLDSELQPRWWMWAGSGISDLRVGPDGQLWSLWGHGVQHFGWDGTIYERWHPNPEQTDLYLPTYRAHHEVWPLADGSFWTFGLETVQFDSYLVSYDDPTPVPGTYLIEDNPPLHVAPDGTVLSRWPLAERIDRGKFGFNCLESHDLSSYDWTHANAISPDEEGGILVSLRNLDAVIRLDAQGELDWILGDPEGWAPPFADRLLTPVLAPGQGSWQWFYHQHAPVWYPEQRLLVMFDNQFHGYTPYGTPPEQSPTSRVVAYEIDPEARTVRQRWAFDQTSTGPLLSEFMGNAQLLPNGNVLAEYGHVEVEGIPHVRIVEFDPDNPSEPALDVELLPDPERAPTGWLVYRVRKIPGF